MTATDGCGAISVAAMGRCCECPLLAGEGAGGPGGSSVNAWLGGGCVWWARPCGALPTLRGATRLLP